MRQAVSTPSAFVPAPAALRRPAGEARRSTARRLPPAARAVMLPLVALAAAATGLVFLVLLPICGIASIAEAMSRRAWLAVRSFMGESSHGSAPR